MKKLASKIIFIALMQGLSNNLLAHVILDYPVGGETFNWGETVTIQWHVYVPHNTLNWDLFFSADGGTTWSPIELNIPVSVLSYQWHVPDTLTSLGMVRVVQDNSQEDYWDACDDFTLEPITLPPLLDVAAMDTTIECNLLTQNIAIQSWLNNNGGAFVTNYCGDLTWSNDYIGISDECGGSGSTWVTFTASDDCGSVITNAILTIVDTEPPVLSQSANNMVVECDGHGNVGQLLSWLNSRGGAMATDAGGNVIWTNNYSSLSDDCGRTGSATIIFTASDQCGNTTTTSATFTIEDTVSPDIDVTAHNLILECGPTSQEVIIVWVNNRGGAIATDACSNVTWTNNFSNISDGCGETGSATVIFTATDKCGNSNTTFASISIIDTIPPSIDVIAHDSILQCGSADQEIIIQNWLDSRGGAIASDVCGSVAWANNYSGLSDGCGATGSASVTFTATDECGNSTTTNSTFTVEDHVAPIIDEVARDTAIDCGLADQNAIIQQWLENHGGAKASDNCSSIIWTNDFLSSSIDSCDVSVLINFTAGDECGNSVTTSATFTILAPSTTSTINISDFDINVFPNPAIETLFIQLDKSEFLPVDIALFDEYGLLRWTQQIQEMDSSIPVTQFSSGIYFLQIKSANSTFLQKVIIGQR